MIFFPATSARRERRWILAIIAVALLLSALPYVFGALRAGGAFVYLWVNPLGAADTNAYFSLMYQAKHGAVFLQNLYTSEPQTGSLFQPLWLVLGWIAGLSRLPIPILFHTARLILGAIFLLALYRLLVTPLLTQAYQRILAMALLAFSSGIGTFFALGVNTGDGQQIQLLLPTDQWVSESNTFLTLLHSPLFILSQLLLVIILWNFVMPQKRSTLFFAALVALLAALHPYDIITSAVLLLAFFVVRLLRENSHTKKEALQTLTTLVLAGLAALPPLLALYVAGVREPAIGAWAQQNITLSPPPQSYIFGYGLLLPFAVIGWMAWRTTRSPLRLLMLTWALVSIALLYLPVQVNRRFSNGLHIPLAILATVGIDVCWQWTQQRFRERRWTRQIILATLAWSLGLGLFLSSAVTIVRVLYWEANPAKSIYHIPRDAAQAIRWLERETPDDAVILAHPFLGNSIPAFTGRRVFLGHGHQTADWWAKVRTVFDWFFKTNTGDDEKRAFLIENGITHILFSPYEDRLGDFEPSQKPYLVPVHTEGEVTVYRVGP